MPTVTTNRNVTIEELTTALQQQLGSSYQITTRKRASRSLEGEAVNRLHRQRTPGPQRRHHHIPRPRRGSDHIADAQ